MRVSKITIGRLFNLGNYEHIRYDVTVEITEGESASKALVGLEKVIESLSPKTSTKNEQELNHEWIQLDRLKALNANDYMREHGHVSGTREEYTARVEKGIRDMVLERALWKRQQKKARELFDNLGGAQQWKDAKLDWQDDYD